MQKAICGNYGDGIRSDCQVILELHDGKKNTITLNSKVESIYGDSIRTLLLEILDYFDTSGAILELNDSGALNFVIAARLMPP